MLQPWWWLEYHQAFLSASATALQAVSRELSWTNSEPHRTNLEHLTRSLTSFVNDNHRRIIVASSMYPHWDPQHRGISIPLWISICRSLAKITSTRMSECIEEDTEDACLILRDRLVTLFRGRPHFREPLQELQPGKEPEHFEQEGNRRPSWTDIIIPLSKLPQLHQARNLDDLQSDYSHEAPFRRYSSMV